MSEKKKELFKDINLFIFDIIFDIIFSILT